MHWDGTWGAKPWEEAESRGLRWLWSSPAPKSSTPGTPQTANGLSDTKKRNDFAQTLGPRGEGEPGSSAWAQEEPRPSVAVQKSGLMQQSTSNCAEVFSYIKDFRSCSASTYVKKHFAIKLNGGRTKLVLKKRPAWQLVQPKILVVLRDHSKMSSLHLTHPK